MPQLRNKALASLPSLLIALIIISLIICRMVFEGGIMLDGVVYINLADNLIAGKGYRFDNLDSSGNFSDWPPLYSALIGFFKAVFSIPGWVASKCVNLLAFCSIIALIIKRWDSKSLPILVPLSFSTSIWIFTYTFSESLFIAFLLVHLLYLEKYLQNKHTKRNFVVVGIAAVAAFYTRYSGIIILPSLLIILFYIRIKSRKWSMQVILSLLIFLGGVALLLTYNKLSSSHWAGVRLASQSNFPGITKELFTTLINELSFWNPTGGYYSSEAIGIIIGLIILAATLILTLKHRPSLLLFGICSMYASIHLFLMWISKSTVAIHWIDQRLLYPFMFLILIGIASLWAESKVKFYGLVQYGVVLLFGLYAAYYFRINFTQQVNGQLQLTKNFNVQLFHLEEKYQKISNGSTVLLGDAKILLTRPDIQLRYPHKWPYYSQNETISAFIERTSSERPDSPLLIAIISPEEARIYDDSFVNFMIDNQPKEFILLNPKSNERN